MHRAHKHHAVAEHAALQQAERAVAAAAALLLYTRNVLQPVAWWALKSAAVGELVSSSQETAQGTCVLSQP